MQKHLVFRQSVGLPASRSSESDSERFLLASVCLYQNPRVEV